MTTNITSTPKPRVEWADTAKALSIIFVVILHVRNELFLFSIQSETLDRLVEISTNLRMPLFFAVAGLFAGKWMRAPWQSLIKQKAALLIWVFLAWQPIILFYKLLNNWALGSFGFDVLMSESARTLLSPLRPNGELWFLWALLIFFLFARLTQQIRPRKQLAIASFVSISWMSIVEPLMSEMVFRAIGSGWNGLFRYYFLFIGFALYSRRIIRHISGCKWHTSMLAFGTWLLTASTVAYFNLPSASTIFLLTILGVVGGLGLAKMVSNIYIFQYLGQKTLQIYLAHSTFIAVFTCLASFLGLVPWMRSNIWATVVILAGMAIVSSLLLSKLRVLRSLYKQPDCFSERLGRIPESSRFRGASGS